MAFAFYHPQQSKTNDSESRQKAYRAVIPIALKGGLCADAIGKVHSSLGLGWELVTTGRPYTLKQGLEYLRGHLSPELFCCVSQAVKNKAQSLPPCQCHNCQNRVMKARKL